MSVSMIVNQVDVWPVFASDFACLKLNLLLPAGLSHVTRPSAETSFKLLPNLTDAP
jgi:hypothetical protein